MTTIGQIPDWQTALLPPPFSIEGKSTRPGESRTEYTPPLPHPAINGRESYLYPSPHTATATILEKRGAGRSMINTVMEA
jgi:hypothetical protein